MGTGAPIPDSVLDDVRGRARSPAVAWLRRATFAALAVVLAVGATGWLGGRSRTTGRRVTQQDYSVTSSVLAVGVFALLTIGLAWANSRFPRIRGVTHGVPVIIVRDGVPDMQRLATERMSLDDLMASARQNGIRRFDEIELAVLETNGKVSFFTRSLDSGDGAPDPPGVI
jgi:hypothetical protein